MVLNLHGIVRLPAPVLMRPSHGAHGNGDVLACQTRDATGTHTLAMALLDARGLLTFIGGASRLHVLKLARVAYQCRIDRELGLSLDTLA